MPFVYNSIRTLLFPFVSEARPHHWKDKPIAFRIFPPTLGILVCLHFFFLPASRLKYTTDDALLDELRQAAMEEFNVIFESQVPSSQVETVNLFDHVFEGKQVSWHIQLLELRRMSPSLMYVEFKSEEDALWALTIRDWESIDRAYVRVGAFKNILVRFCCPIDQCTRENCKSLSDRIFSKFEDISKNYS